MTGKYNKQIIRAYTEPRYAAYLMQRFDWRDSVFGSISWESFRTAMRRIRQDTVLTKICNDILPTNKRLWQIGFSTTDRCCCCDEIETFDHILTCDGESRLKWRHGFTCGLHKKMIGSGTHDDLIQCMIECLDQWFTQGHVLLDRHPLQFQDAI